MGTLTTKTETGLTCNTAYTRYVWAYNSCGTSASTALTQTTSACPWSCEQSITINHVAGNVTPVCKIVAYGTVTNIPGEASKCWITSNLGADHQATAVNDATEASAGWYWQFNRMQGYKNDGTNLTPVWTITSISENTNWLSVNDPCSAELSNGWRIPTRTEWTNVDAGGGWNNWNGPWNLLKIHAAVFLSPANGSVGNRGSDGSYYSSTQDGSSNGWDLQFHSSYSGINTYVKAHAFSIRCILE